MDQMHPIHEEKQHAEQTGRACAQPAQCPEQVVCRPSTDHSVACVSCYPGDCDHRFRSVGVETSLDDAKMAGGLAAKVALGIFITVQAGSPVPNSNATTVNGQNTVQCAGAT